MKGAGAAKPLLMGILNVTPDSFSDGGRHADASAAIRHGVQMAADGADVVDIGGESTRPGASRVDAAEQLLRVLPVLTALRRELPDACRLSIDTTRADVASAAVDAGATMINDVSAGRDDPALLPLAARTGVDLVLMHMQGTPETMQREPCYRDVVAEVREVLVQRAAAAQAAGVARERIWVDPGIGFGKTRAHNLELLAHLDAFVATGYPVLLGTSRKRFMGSICNVERYDELAAATCATTALGVIAGVRMFRVHDVRENRQALDVAWAIFRQGSDELQAASNT
jgi:dihydropteroate synthase